MWKSQIQALMECTSNRIETIHDGKRIDQPNGILVDFDENKVYATDQNCCVCVSNVHDLKGEGKVFITKDVLEKVFKLKGNPDILITPTEIGGLPYEPIMETMDFITECFPKQFNEVRSFGLFTAKAMIAYERLEAVFGSFETHKSWGNGNLYAENNRPLRNKVKFIAMSLSL